MSPVARWGSPPPAALISVLERFTYYPRWRFSVSEACGMWALQVRTWVEDAYNQGQWRAGAFTTLVPPGADCWDEQMAMGWLREQCHFIAVHEADEFFMVDGRRPFDPHSSKTAGEAGSGARS